MRNGLILVGIAFAVGLAYFLGNRLSNEAMAVVVGAVCGISASIPVSIGLVIASSNNWGRREQAEYSYTVNRYMPRPPVMLIQPPQAQVPMAPQGQYYFPKPTPQAAPEPREFKIVEDKSSWGRATITYSDIVNVIYGAPPSQHDACFLAQKVSDETINTLESEGYAIERKELGGRVMVVVKWNNGPREFKIIGGE